jgi:hypothetical protein
MMPLVNSWRYFKSTSGDCREHPKLFNSVRSLGMPVCLRVSSLAHPYSYCTLSDDTQQLIAGGGRNGEAKEEEEELETLEQIQVRKACELILAYLDAWYAGDSTRSENLLEELNQTLEVRYASTWAPLLRARGTAEWVTHRLLRIHPTGDGHTPNGSH